MLHDAAVPKPVSDLLARLATRQELQDFALGGGTSLALRFGHRMSVDLDFFTLLKFYSDDLFASLDMDSATVVRRAANSLTVDVDGVKLDLLRHAYPLIEPVEILAGIRFVSLPDLVAMKLNAIANRGSKKDFYDLVELMKHFSLEQMLDFFTRKYSSSDVFTVIRSLAWFEDAEAEPDPVSLIGLEWQMVKSRIRDAVAAL